MINVELPMYVCMSGHVWFISLSYGWTTEANVPDRILENCDIVKHNKEWYCEKKQGVIYIYYIILYNWYILMSQK